MATTAQLKKFMRDGRVVQFTTPYDAAPCSALVIDVGPTFVLFARLNDGVLHDGYDVNPTKDIRNLKPHPHSSFCTEAIRLHPNRARRKPKLVLTDIRSVIETAARQFPLVTLNMERARPRVAHVGRPLRFEASRVWTIDIAAGAIWHDEPAAHVLRSITRVSFGGWYEQALHLVGGPPPKLAPERLQRTT